MRRQAGERGSILPLIFGFFAVALALVLVATAATSLYLERSRLYTLADGAALAAAQSLALEAALTAADPSAHRAAVVDSATLSTAASRYLKLATAGRSQPVTLVSADSPDGRDAHVRLATRWRPPIITPFVPAGIRVEVAASARPVFR